MIAERRMGKSQGGPSMNEKGVDTSSTGQLSSLMRFGFSRVFPWSFILMGAIPFGFGIRGIVLASASTDWPHTAGRVVSSTLEHDDEQAAYPRIIYEFDLNGTRFQGDRVHFGGYRSRDDPYALRLVKQYPEGTEVTVYYMPDNPESSLLEPGIRWHAWLMPGVGAVFLIIGFVLLAVVPKLLREGSPPAV
jgi:hypothetical protein